jgi:hypothetical protein
VPLWFVFVIINGVESWVELFGLTGACVCVCVQRASRLMMHMCGSLKEMINSVGKVHVSLCRWIRNDEG